MVGQPVPVTGISLGVAWTIGVEVALKVGVAEALGLEVALKVGVAVGVDEGDAVAVAVGVGVVQALMLVVQAIPGEGQQNLVPSGPQISTLPAD
jgi:hypothetical protein